MAEQKSKEIGTLEALIEYAAAVAADPSIYTPVTLSSETYTFKMKVEGEGWDKRMDARHARYMLALQDTLEEFHADLKPPSVDVPFPLVKAEISEGSSEVLPELVNFLRAICTPMTDVQTFITAMTAVAGVAGYLTFGRWADYRKEQAKSQADLQELSIHETTKREMLQPLLAYAANNPAIAVSSEQPLRTLVNSMEPEDEITLAGGVTPLPQGEARRSLPRSPRSKASTSYADGSYLLRNIDYSLGELVLYLMQDKLLLRAYTSELSEEDTDALFQEIMERQKAEELPFSIALQVNVHHTPKKLNHGSIVGVGAPRPDKAHASLGQLVPLPAK